MTMDNTENSQPPATGADAGAIALLRCLTMNELADAYLRAKDDETDKGQHAAALIGRELTRRVPTL